jgi:hypothetical protein
MPKSQDPLYDNEHDDDDNNDDIKWIHIDDFMKILELPSKLVVSMRLIWSFDHINMDIPLDSKEINKMYVRFYHHWPTRCMLNVVDHLFRGKIQNPPTCNKIEQISAQHFITWHEQGHIRIET